MTGTAHQVAEIAGILSRIVGSVCALECARNAVCAIACEEKPLTAFVACIAHRRKHATTYGEEWSRVTDAQAAAMVAAAVTVWAGGGRGDESAASA